MSPPTYSDKDLFHSQETNPELNDLGIIFEVGLTDLSLFPNIKLSDSATYMDYLEKWIKGYADATANPPSRRKASSKRKLF